MCDNRIVGRDVWQFSVKMRVVLKTSMTTLSMRLFNSPKRLYSVQTITVNEYSKILKSKDREKYQIVDVREPDELNSVNVDDKDIMNLPISQSWKWGTDIARHQHPLDPVKPVICVVSCYHLLSAVLLLRSHLFSSFCLSSAVLVGEV
jgi:rhodanese-related sulfurtransferase